MGMNTFTFDGSWNQIKGQLLQKFAVLKDDDLEFLEGKGEEMLGRLQTKLGLTEAALVGQLNELKESAPKLAEGVRAKVSEATARVGEAVGDMKEKATEAAGEAYEYTRRSVRTLHEEAEDYVSQQPVQALLAAFAVGFLAGLLIRR